MYKQCQTDIGKKSSKANQHPEDDLLINLSNKQVCLYQWDYMINWNKNEKNNCRINQANKKYIDEDVDIEANVERIACLNKTTSPCNKHHLSNIWGSIC